MDEVDTMAERDLGSTFLLPHTHLYKPERVSVDSAVMDLTTFTISFLISLRAFSREATYPISIRYNDTRSTIERNEVQTKNE